MQPEIGAKASDVPKAGKPLLTMFIIEIAVSFLTLGICLTLLIFIITMSHRRNAEHDEMLRDIVALSESKANSVDSTESFHNLDDKLNSIFGSITKIEQRQIINEANIDINHNLLKGINKTIPTTKPVRVPDQIPLPPR
jgi:hypothetical protein